MALARPQAGLGERRRIGVVVHRHRRPQRLLQDIPGGHALPARQVGGRDDQPSGIVDMPGKGRAYA